MKYDQITLALINAIKEQQAQIAVQRSVIDEQKAEIGKQRRQLEALTRLICSQNAAAEICKEDK